MKTKTPSWLLLLLLFPAGCASRAVQRVEIGIPVPGSGSLELDASARVHGPLIAFQPNVGQFADTVRYAAHPKGFKVWLTDDRIVMLDDRDGSTPFAIRPFAGCKSPHPEAKIGTLVDKIRSVKPHRQPLSMPLYRAVRYRGIQPGIDLDAHGIDGGWFELAFHVSPGASPQSIAIAYEGRTVSVEPDGSLLLSNGEERVHSSVPFAWQPGDGGAVVRVDAKYVLKSDGKIGYELGAYDHAKELVIE
jgi:hypothetical protein